MSNVTTTTNTTAGVITGFQVQVPTVVKGGGCRPCSTASVGSGQSWNGNNRCEDEGDDLVLADDDCGCGGGGNDSTRGPSPDPDSCAAGAEQGGLSSSEPRSRGRHNLQVPSEHYGFFGSGRKSITRLSETLFEEESDLIRSCGALSTVLGLRKSFSTSDISQSTSQTSSDPLKMSSSEMTLCGGLLGGVRDDFVLSTHMVGCLDYTSRSCSTWVAVGDMASTSQLPSPQGNPPTGGQLTDSPPVMLAAEFIRSVNKKVRQTYIKRRLLTTYKALERMAQSELNLQVCGKGQTTTTTNRPAEVGPWAALVGQKVSKSQVSREILKLLRRDFDPQRGFGLLTAAAAAKNLSLTAKDVENEKGKPLSKFERNMIIFNWLHTLGDHAYDRLA